MARCKIHLFQEKKVVIPKIIGNKVYLHSLERAKRDVFTAKVNSMGNSGGTTEVRIKIHSKNNLYLFLDGFLEPSIQR